MRILLDEMIPRRLKRSFPAHIEVMTVRERGWSSKKNGELLALAQKEFDVMLTTDRGIPHQQNLTRFDIEIIILAARSNRIADIEPEMEAVIRRVEKLENSQT